MKATVSDGASGASGACWCAHCPQGPVASGSSAPSSMPVCQTAFSTRYNRM